MALRFPYCLLIHYFHHTFALCRGEPGHVPYLGANIDRDIRPCSGLSLFTWISDGANEGADGLSVL
jgi:hypothetical protein